MPLKRPRYRVWLNIEGRDLTTDLPPDHLVTVTHGDQLRAELEASKLHLPEMSKAPMTYTTLWVWCALARQGLTTANYMKFQNQELAELEKDEDGLEPVDPTGTSIG